MAVAGERLGIGIQRHFTTESRHPYDDVVWERRDSRISDYRTGTVASSSSALRCLPAGV